MLRRMNVLLFINSKRYTLPPVRADPEQVIRMTDTK